MSIWTPGVITFRRGKLGKARLLPVSESDHEPGCAPMPGNAIGFSARARKPSSSSDVASGSPTARARYNFAAVCQAIGLRAAEKFHRHGRGPRIHDLRHTFAVRTLIDWYRTGKDPDAGDDQAHDLSRAQQSGAHLLVHRGRSGAARTCLAGAPRLRWRGGRP